MIELALDLSLAGMLVLMAVCLLTTTDHFKAVVLFIPFGLLMALCWVRLQAPDIALAEAGIGAGLTGALFLAALRRIRRAQAQKGLSEDPEVQKD